MTSMEEFGAQPAIMGVYSTSQAHTDMALLDNATTYMILWDLGYFDFSRHKSEALQTCDLNTIARRRDFKFCEGCGVARRRHPCV